MKLKLVVVDLELTRSQKRIGAAGLALAFALISGAALADLPKTFVAGETLKAADLMANFNALDTRLAAAEADAADAAQRLATLEAPPTYLVTTSDQPQTGANNADLVYDSMEVTLEAGTWLVEATATLATTDVPDTVQLGLWNQTTAADIPNSRGGVGTSVALNGGSVCAPAPCLPAPGYASAVITVATPTTVRAKAFNNGSSTLKMGPYFVGFLLSPASRISALKLR